MKRRLVIAGWGVTVGVYIERREYGTLAIISLALLILCVLFEPNPKERPC